MQECNIIEPSVSGHIWLTISRNAATSPCFGKVSFRLTLH